MIDPVVVVASVVVLVLVVVVVDDVVVVEGKQHLSKCLFWNLFYLPLVRQRLCLCCLIVDVDVVGVVVGVDGRIVQEIGTDIVIE